MSSYNNYRRQAGDNGGRPSSGGYGRYKNGQSAYGQQQAGAGSSYVPYNRPQNRRGGYGSNAGFSGQSHSYGGQRDQQRSSNGAQRDRPDSRYQLQIWMGDLDPSWTEDAIIRIWNSLGEAPLSVKIMRDKNDPSPNPRPLYCFVNFASEAAVASALSKNGQLVPGSDRHLKLNAASGGGERAGASSGFSGSGENSGRKPQDDFSLVINDLDPSIKEQQIFEVFSNRFPNSVRQVKIINDSTTGAPKGYGFIKFNSSQTQQIALREMNNVVIDGKPIRLSTGPTHSKAELSTSSSELAAVQLPQEQPKLNKFTNPFNTTITIKGLASRFTEKELEVFLLSFGDIISLDMAPHLDSCTATYKQRDAAETAILALNRSRVHDTDLSVNWGDSPITAIASAGKSGEIPKFFGVGKTPVRFDKMSADEVKAWSESIYEVSEPHKPELVDTYIGSKELQLL